jgi:hypothetical protein
MSNSRRLERVLGTLGVMLLWVWGPAQAVDLHFISAILNVDTETLGIDHTNVRDDRGTFPELRLRYPYAVSDHLILLKDIENNPRETRALLFPLAPAGAAQLPLNAIPQTTPSERSTAQMFAPPGEVRQPVLGFFSGLTYPMVKQRDEGGWSVVELAPGGAVVKSYAEGENIDEVRQLSAEERLVVAGGRLVRKGPDETFTMWDRDVKSFDIGRDTGLVAIGYRDDDNNGRVCIKRLSAPCSEPCLADIAPESRAAAAQTGPFADLTTAPAAVTRGVLYPLLSASGRHLAVIREIPDRKSRGNLEIYDLHDPAAPRRIADIPDVHFFDVRLYEDPFSYPRSYSWVGERIVFRPAEQGAQSRRFGYLDADRCTDTCEPLFAELPDCVVYDYPALKEEVQEPGKSVLMVRAAPADMGCTDEARARGFVELKIMGIDEVQAHRNAGSDYLYAQVTLRSMNSVFNDAPGGKLPEPQSRVVIFRLGDAGP